MIRRVEELDVDARLAADLAALLAECFPGYPPRTYFKLPPQARLLAERDGRVVGQVGVLQRPIRIDATVAQVLGVVDLAVAGDARSHGVGGRLLDAACALAVAGRQDFVLLFADDQRLYARHGFELVDNPCTWLKIDEHRTLGIAEPVSLADCMMVRRVGGAAWPRGTVDLLGHLW